MSLARACYSDAEIYLLDDPLSAVDPSVAGKLFSNCILGYLRNKTRILVTHQISFLPRIPQILMLEDGHQTFIGSYKELGDFEQSRGSELSILLEN